MSSQLKQNDSVNPVGGENEFSTETDYANSGSTHCSPILSGRTYTMQPLEDRKQLFKQALKIDPQNIPYGMVMVRVDGENQGMGELLIAHLKRAGVIAQPVNMWGKDKENIQFMPMAPRG